MGQLESAFIVNRNDIECSFVESKIDSKLGPVYYLYHSKEEKPLVFSPGIFYDTHSNDGIIPVSDFIENTLCELRLYCGTDLNIDQTFNKLSLVQSKIRNCRDYKNPSLGKHKGTLIDAISGYNAVKKMISIEAEIPFIENYELVKEDSESVLVSSYVSDDRVASKQSDINSLNFGGIQRQRKYDN